MAFEIYFLLFYLEYSFFLSVGLQILTFTAILIIIRNILMDLSQFLKSYLLFGNKCVHVNSFREIMLLRVSLFALFIVIFKNLFLL